MPIATAEKYAVELGVPIPKVSRNPELKSLAESMIVTASILFSKEKEARLFRRILRNCGFKSTFRAEGDGFRVWKGEAVAQ